MPRTALAESRPFDPRLTDPSVDIRTLRLLKDGVLLMRRDRAPLIQEPQVKYIGNGFYAALLISRARSAFDVDLSLVILDGGNHVECLRADVHSAERADFSWDARMEWIDLYDGPRPPLLLGRLTRPQAQRNLRALARFYASPPCANDQTAP